MTRSCGGAVATTAGGSPAIVSCARVIAYARSLCTCAASAALRAAYIGAAPGGTSKPLRGAGGSSGAAAPLLRCCGGGGGALGAEGPAAEAAWCLAIAASTPPGNTAGWSTPS